MGPTLVVFARGSGPDGPRLRGRAGRPAGCGRGLERFLPIRNRSSLLLSLDFVSPKLGDSKRLQQSKNHVRFDLVIGK